MIRLHSLSLLFALAATAFLGGCRSHKEVVSDNSLSVDSIARSEHHRTIVCIDSAVRRLDFDFDTLNVEIQRPSSVAEAPEVIRLKAVRGRVIDRRRVHRNCVEAFNQLDTVAYHQSAAETSTEHSATTRLYNPPDGTAMFVITILVIGGLLYVFYRKR